MRLGELEPCTVSIAACVGTFEEQDLELILYDGTKHRVLLLCERRSIIDGFSKVFHGTHAFVWMTREDRDRVNTAVSRSLRKGGSVESESGQEHPGMPQDSDIPRARPRDFVSKQSKSNDRFRTSLHLTSIRHLPFLPFSPISKKTDSLSNNASAIVFYWHWPYPTKSPFEIASYVASFIL
ncbi:hypothetical protein CPB85DRAFT_1249441 [Mucidula mucida]|nr:hypothetical protein CPB85DRAFT_1249441 [Mucidula mucida]